MPTNQLNITILDQMMDDARECNKRLSKLNERRPSPPTVNLAWAQRQRQVLEATPTEGQATSAETADMIGISYQQAGSILKKLHAAGLVERTTVTQPTGGKMYLWQRKEGGE